MPLLQFKVHADYEEVIRLRKEIDNLEATLKGFGPGTTEATIHKIEQQLASAKAQFHKLADEAIVAGAAVEKSLQESLAKAQRRGTVNVKADISDFQKKNNQLLRDVDNTLRKLEEFGDKSSNVLKSVSQVAGLTVAGMGLMEFANQIKRVRGEFQQYEVAFETMLGSASKANELMSQLTKTAAITPFDLQGVTNGAKQLLAYGIASDEVNEKLIQLGDIAAGLSLPLGDLVYLYGTTMVQGRMFTQDLRQFQGRGIPIAKELAKQFGVAENKVGELVTAGKVGAAEFTKAIESMAGAGGQFGGLMEKQSMTITGQISNIEDAIDSMFNEMGKSSEGVINKTLSGVSSLVENYQQVGRALTGLIVTYGTYKTALMLVAAAKGWATAAEALHYNWLLLVEKAQKMLNATMLKNPYVLVATLIAGVVMAMVSMKTEAERLREAEQEYENQLNKTIEAEEEHRHKMEELCSIAGDEALSTDTRREALNELEKKYPDIFAKYDTEFEKLSNIKKIKQEIAELDGKASMKKSQNQLSSVESRIAELEQKQATERTVLRYGKLRRVGGLTRSEKDELAMLQGKRTQLTQQVNKDNADAYLTALTGVSDADLKAEIKARKDILAQLKMNNGNSGKINGGGASGTFSKDEIQYQLNKLNDELNRRAMPKDSSKDWRSKAKKKYQEALKAYNDFISDASNSLNQEDFEKKAKELKDAADSAKKEYNKTEPMRDGGKNNDPKQRAYEREKAEREENERLAELRLKAEQDAKDLEISMMKDGTEKEIAQIHNDAQKKRDALIKERKKEADRLKQFDLQQWMKGGKNRKAYQWRQSKTDEQYLADAAENIGYDGQLSEIAYNESKELQEVYREELASMRDYLKEYGTFEQRKLAIAQEYAQKIKEARNEGERLQFESEQKKALEDIETQAITAKIDWYSVFDNVGMVMRGQLQPLYDDLQKYVQTDAFKQSGAENQRAVVEAMQRLREQLGTGDMGWKDLASSMTGYQQALNDLKKATDEHRLVIEEQMRLQSDESIAEDALKAARDNLAKGIGSQTDLDNAQAVYDQAHKAVQEFGDKAKQSADAVQQAQSTVTTSGTMLSQTANNVMHPVDEISTFLTSSSIPQLGELYNSFQTLKGSINALKGIKEASKDIKEGVADAAGTMSEAGEVVGEKLPESITDAMGNAGVWGQLISAVLSILDILKDGIGTLVSNIIDTVLQAISGLLDNILSGKFAVQIGESLFKGIGGIFKSITTLGGLFDWWGKGESDPELEKDVERLTLTNEALRKAIEDLTDEMRDSSIGDVIAKYEEAKANYEQSQANTQEMMRREGAAYSNGFLGIGGKKSSNHKIDNALSDEDWKRISEKAGVSVRSAAEFWNLTPEQMAKVKKGAADLYAKIKQYADDGYKNASQYMDDYVDYYEELLELEKARSEALTSISLDSVKDEFKSILGDMESDAEDFAEDFERMMQQAVINAFVNELFAEKIEEWYKRFADMMASDEKLSAYEQSQLEQEWNDIVNDALRQRDELAKAMGWDTSVAQQSSRRSLAGMSQDTGDAIEGRLTAIQIATESIRAAEHESMISLAKITESVLATMMRNNSMEQHYVGIEQQIAKCYIELATISENTGAVVKPIRNMEAYLNEMNRNIKQL